MQAIETALGRYTLQRLPLLKDDNNKDQLRAWDAADEYLLNHLLEHLEHQLVTNDRPILLINDSFGALAVSLHQHSVHSWSDSFVAHQAALHNLALNNLHSDFQAIPSTTALNPKKQNNDESSPRYQLVLIKIPKTIALLEHQLIQLKPYLDPSCTIIAAGMAKHIHTSTLKMFEKIIGTTTTSLAKKKARLIFAVNDQQTATTSRYPKIITEDSLKLTLSHHANVFSKDRLDIGARFMIEQLQQHLPQIQKKAEVQNIIDLGCGNGVLGIMAKRLLPDSCISFVDESYMAVDSAKTNYFANIDNDDSDTNNDTSPHFQVGDCLAQFKNETTHNEADLILCNPPFHQAHAIGDQIAWQMFKQSKQQLKENTGQLWVIGNRHLGYHIKLKKLFGNCKTIASNKKFVVLVSNK